MKSMNSHWNYEQISPRFVTDPNIRMFESITIGLGLVDFEAALARAASAAGKTPSISVPTSGLMQVSGRRACP